MTIPYRLITFDATNTLLKFRKPVIEIYTQVGKRFGVTCNENQISKNFKTRMKLMLTEHPNFGLHSLGWQEWWRKMVQDTFLDCNPNIPKLKLEDMSKHLIELFKTSECWQPATGSFELLQYLKDRGVALGVISNFDPRLHQILNNTKLDHYFNFILTSYEAGCEKPSGEIFKKAAELSGLTDLKAKECLHVGDSETLDYKAAKNCGWDSCLMLKNKSEKLNLNLKPDEIFSDFNDLQNFLKRH